MIPLAVWPWVYLGIPIAVALWFAVGWWGRWEWKEDRERWMKAGRLTAYLITALLVGYAISGVG